jgi:hypothetical protein
VALVLAELNPAARILLRDEEDHALQTIVRHKGIHGVVGALEVLVGEDLMDGAVTITAEGQGILASATLGDEVVIRGV